MTGLRAWAAAVAISLSLSSCSDSGDQAQEDEGTASSNGMVHPSEKAEPSNPAPGAVPVAIITGPEDPYLTLGVLLRPSHPLLKGQLAVCFQSPPEGKCPAAYVFAGKEADAAWHKCRLSGVKTPDGLKIASLPDGPQFDALALGGTQPLPESVDVLFSAQWGDPLEDRDPNRTLSPEMQLRQEYRLLGEEVRRLQSADTKDQNLTPEERALEIRKLSQQMRAVRSEASRLGINLVADSRRPRIEPPARTASVERVALRATRSADSGKTRSYRITAEATSRDYLSPNAFIARASGESLRAHALQEVAAMIQPEVGEPTASIQVRPGKDPTLTIRVEMPSPYLAPPELALAVAPEGAMPNDLNQAPFFNPASSRRSSSGSILESTVLLPRAKLKSNQIFEASYGVRLDRSAAWQPSERFSFELQSGPNGQVVPKLSVSPAIAWKSPPVSNHTLQHAPFLNAVATDGTIVRAKLAAGGRFLAVLTATPNKLRLLDLEKEQWLGELELPPEESSVCFAANAEFLYVSASKARTLTSYSLPKLEKVNSVGYSHQGAPLDLSAGYASRESPLLVASLDRIVLLDPASLRPSPQVIRRPKTGISKNAPSISSAPALFRTAAPQKKFEYTFKLVAHAAPSGDLFTIAVKPFSGAAALPAKMWALDRLANHWSLAWTDLSLPAPGGFRFQPNGLETRAGKNLAAPRSFDAQLLMPAGGGIMAVRTPPAQLGYHPSPPADFRFYGDLKADALITSFHAASPATSGLTEPWEISTRLFVMPRMQKIVSVGTNRVTFEAIPGRAEFPERVLGGPAPDAARGTSWTYRPRGRNDSAVATKILKGPENATVDAAGTITWKVPSDYPLDFAVFSLALGKPAITQTLTLSVRGSPPALLQKEGRKETAVVDSSSEVFPGGIDRVLASHSSPRVVVVSGGYRRFSVFNLETFKVESRMDSPRGVAACALGSKALYLYYPDGGLVEERSLPGLQAKRIQPCSFSSEILAFAAGSGPNALPPLGVFNNGPGKNVARVLDLKTLVFGPEIPLPRVNLDRFLPSEKPQAPMATSPDGSLIVCNDMGIVRERDADLEVRRISRDTVRKNPTNLAPDKRTLFIQDKAQDLKTDRVWSLTLGRGKPVMLIPDHHGILVAAVKADYENNQFLGQRLLFVDAKTQERKFELHRLAEWDRPLSERTPWDHCTERIHYWARTRILLTVSSDGYHLVARRLPDLN